MEPNAVPGLTNRRMAPWTERALVNFPETGEWFPRAEVTGVPVRSDFFQAPPEPPGHTFTLLVTGGSQGSRRLNDASRESWPLFAESRLGPRIMHQAGPGNASALASEFRKAGLEGQVVEFIDDMASAFAEAHLIICRAGASTVAELAAAGRPAILVPFPFAADNHQQHNAEAMERAGAARMILDSEMDGRRLFQEVAALMRDPARLRQMRANARSLRKIGAAARAADVLEEVAVR
jgi:UDP-N-acetylglucosamine--N-acetylmuramyl-(pentapeptide) pyrophosphoryl-undecaprenol N-acetylglucosamine transferase